MNRRPHGRTSDNRSSADDGRLAGVRVDVPEAFVELLAERVAGHVAERLERPSPPTPWLDVAGAADYLACEPHRIYDRVSSGRLRCAKDGRRSLFRREWLDGCLDGGGE